MIRISAERLARVVSGVFAAAGVPEGDAVQVAESLVENNLVGHDSHGVLRVGSYLQALEQGRLDPHGKTRILRETATTAVLDGGRNWGVLVARAAMDLAMAKASQHDLGLVATRNTAHTGRLGEYVVRAARQGYMAMVIGTGSRPGGTVAPFGAASPVFNTNPLSWGVPANRFPAVFVDFATSAAAWGKIQSALDKGSPIPLGWLLDADGRPTTDPEDQRRGGVQLPFGDHKGSGLAFMVEILCGGLSGVSCAPLGDYTGEFVLVMGAVNIAAFQPLDRFRAQVDGLVDAVKGARKAPGVEEILAPGEIEWRTREQRLRDGIEVPEAAWERIVDAGRRYGWPVTLD
jgi:LDH2 family malate/lactate/ureidoglycolate dehydrogenase